MDTATCSNRFYHYMAIDVGTVNRVSLIIWQTGTWIICPSTKFYIRLEGSTQNRKRQWSAIEQRGGGRRPCLVVKFPYDIGVLEAASVAADRSYLDALALVRQLGRTKGGEPLIEWIVLQNATDQFQEEATARAHLNDPGPLETNDPRNIGEVLRRTWGDLHRLIRDCSQPRMSVLPYRNCQQNDRLQ